MDIWIIVLRTIFVYLIMVVVVHAFGKKEMARLPLLNIFIGFMIAHLAARSLENVQAPMLSNLLPISLLVVLQIGYVYFSSKAKNWKARTGEKGQLREAWPNKKQPYTIDVPLVLIKDGHLLTENMAKLGKTDFWLKAELKKRIGFTNFKYISFCSIDGFGHWYIDVKDYLPQK